MDEETAIINSNTRNEKIRNFFVNNKKTLLTFVVIIIAILFGYFAFEEYKETKNCRKKSHNEWVALYRLNCVTQLIMKQLIYLDLRWRLP